VTDSSFRRKENTVAEDTNHPPGPFSVETVKALIRLMAQYNLNEIDLQQGDQRLRLRRGTAGKVVAVAPTPEVAPPPAALAPAPAKPAPPAPTAPSKTLHEIKSELIGTFYASASPDAEPFVKVGSRVKKDDVLCLIEAMKVFNEVTADRPGVIVEVCVQNQQPVEFGQVLFRLDPTA
jgi:acetyl-CoA carboxylase biotin carboxyl carrier protein